MFPKFKPMLAKVKYFPIGMIYGIPRLPIFLGFRDNIDIGE